MVEDKKKPRQGPPVEDLNRSLKRARGKLQEVHTAVYKALHEGPRGNRVLRKKLETLGQALAQLDRLKFEQEDLDGPEK